MLRHLRATDAMRNFSEFRQEASTLHALQHPCIVALIGISIHPLCFALELAPLGSLNTVLSEKAKGNHYTQNLPQGLPGAQPDPARARPKSTTPHVLGSPCPKEPSGARRTCPQPTCDGLWGERSFARSEHWGWCWPDWRSRIEPYSKSGFFAITQELVHLLIRQRKVVIDLLRKQSKASREAAQGVPVVVQWLRNPTRNDEVADSIPGLVQWVEDLVLP